MVSLLTAILACILAVCCLILIKEYQRVQKKLVEKQREYPFYNGGRPPQFYITGDKHRHFDNIIRFCRDMRTQRKDVLIILGDTGFNYFGDQRDDELKTRVASLPITLFCLHGNKENRPQHVGTYGVRNFCGGKVFYEPQYPNLLFAIDGEIYNFDGNDYMVVGGAHSVDKQYCLEEKKPYWEDEVPDDMTKQRIEQKLAQRNNTIYGMLTHTCPLRYLPTEMFMSTRQAKQNKQTSPKNCIWKTPKKTFKPDIDRSTEEWLDKLEQVLTYKHWFCGHYHVDKSIDKLHMMHKEIRPLHLPEGTHDFAE